MDESIRGPRVTRRGALIAGVAALAAGAGGVAGATIEHGSRPGPANDETEPFWGEHQSGIATDTQRNVVLAAFDMTSSDRAELAALLQAWTRLGAH